MPALEACRFEMHGCVVVMLVEDQAGAQRQGEVMAALAQLLSSGAVRDRLQVPTGAAMEERRPAAEMAPADTVAMTRGGAAQLTLLASEEPPLARSAKFAKPWQ